MLATDFPGATWRKSSRSANNCACVEAAVLNDGRVAVRDSKNPDGPALVFTPVEWDAFIVGAQGGEFTRERLAANAETPSLPV
ncbi:DUF397 domain-containing protein [Sphaerimonospora cavernae]|uniref:DUF397 domain-containing protein n=1 Tax=Sphaerimonospora cavernae TaxID=1740611 RepID=A0ABV6TXJ8_9ACTN